MHAPVLVAAMQVTCLIFPPSSTLLLVWASFVFHREVFSVVHYNELQQNFHRNPNRLHLIHSQETVSGFHLPLLLLFLVLLNLHDLSLSAAQLYPLILPHRPCEKS